MKIARGDLHADTIQYGLDNNLSLDDISLSFNTFDTRDYLPYIQFLACFVHDDFSKSGFSRVNKMLDYYFKEEQKNSKTIYTIKNKQDIHDIVFNNKLGTLLTVENGAALDGKAENIYKLFERCVRAMTITWNYDNELGSGNMSKIDTGLSKFGKRCIDIMNNIGMIVDVSHASRKTFWDIANITTKPIIASHSNAYAICNHNRNLTDMQIKEIANLHGIIGVTYYNKFLSNNNRTSIGDVVKQIEYISHLVGTDYVCVGSDFDGVNKKYLPENLKGVKDIYKLEDCMLMRGFTTLEIQNIMGKNMIRFLENNLC